MVTQNRQSISGRENLSANTTPLKVRPTTPSKRAASPSKRAGSPSVTSKTINANGATTAPTLRPPSLSAAKLKSSSVSSESQSLSPTVVVIPRYGTPTSSSVRPRSSSIGVNRPSSAPKQRPTTHTAPLAGDTHTTGVDASSGDAVGVGVTGIGSAAKGGGTDMYQRAVEHREQVAERRRLAEGQ